jgi:hypothetical protein
MFSHLLILDSRDSFTDVEGVVVSYQNGPIAQEVSAELIFGAIEAKGNYPLPLLQILPLIPTEKIKCFRIYGSRKCWNEPFNF